LLENPLEYCSRALDENSDSNIDCNKSVKLITAKELQQNRESQIQNKQNEWQDKLVFSGSEDEHNITT